MSPRRSAMALLGLVIVFGVVTAVAQAAEPVEGKNNKLTFEGTYWGRYSYLLEDLSEKDPSIDYNGFAIDRIYLTMSSQLGEKQMGRIRFEADNQNDGASKIFLKTAEVVVTEPFCLKASKFRFGQTEGLATVWYEKPWGYRVVSKTVPDRYLGISSTYLLAGLLTNWLDGMVETDLVVANRAPFNRDVASGATNPKYWTTDGRVDSIASGPANPKFKIFGARAYLTPFKEGPAKGVGVGGYVQMASDAPDEYGLKASDKQTFWYGAHAFYMSEKLNGGVEYDTRVRKTPNFKIDESGSPPDTTMDEFTSTVVSLVGRYYITDRIEVFGRYDMVDYNTDADKIEFNAKNSKQLLAILQPAENVLMLGVSRACTKTLRAILDVSFRSITDDVYSVEEVAGLPATKTKLEFDDEIIISARLEAKL